MFENSAFEELKSFIDHSRITDDLKKWYEAELFYLECNPDAANYLVSTKKRLGSKKAKNINSSTVVYLIGLTDEKPVNPVKKVLGSLPDVDYDCSNRDGIKDYLVNKYGRDHVALIGTYSALATRGALKDVVRQYGKDISFEEVNDVCDLFSIVKEADYSQEIDFFNAALENSPPLREWFGKHHKIKDLVTKIIGTNKNTGIHAGGIIVSRSIVTDVCPMKYSKEDELFVSQPEMGDVEYLGLIKFDFLGLTTLNIIRDAFKMIRERHSVCLTMRDKDIPKNEKIVLDYLKRGETLGFFQFNTDLVVGCLVQHKSVDSVEDASIVTSVMRPGPMDSGIVEQYIARKNGTAPVVYDHPIEQPILEKTYGLYVYQEQIMRVLTDMGGLSGHDGYALIKAISKKDEKKIGSYGASFSSGALQKGVKQQVVDKIWNTILAFAGYGFNKSHAMAYTITGYICAWLRHHYPLEFMAATLSHSNGDDFKILFPKWKEYLVNPSVKYSRDKFFIAENNKIAIPLSRIKGIGAACVDDILKYGPYESFGDYLIKQDEAEKSKARGKKTIESLIFSGAFDSYGKQDLAPREVFHARQVLFEEFICFTHGLRLRTEEERCDGISLSSQKKKPSKSLLEDEAELVEKLSMRNGEILNMELRLLGFSTFNYYDFLGDAGYSKAKTKFKDTPYMSIREILESAKEMDAKFRKTKNYKCLDVVTVGAVGEVKIFTIKKEGKNKGRQMAKIKLCEDSAVLEITVWPDHLKKDELKGGLIKSLQEMSALMLKGQVNIYNGSISIVLEHAFTLN